jgi:hypothetical protein
MGRTIIDIDRTLALDGYIAVKKADHEDALQRVIHLANERTVFIKALISIYLDDMTIEEAKALAFSVLEKTSSKGGNA